ncbi:RGM domain family member B [Octopus sinensis]|nr:RGM domain family member B [Octopus sinensis]XP_036356264.1 RGM domain family member B [Octopus sinensis]
MEGCSCSHHYCHQLRNIRNRTMLSVAPPMAYTERTVDLIMPVMTSVAPIRAQSFPSGHQLMNNQSSAITPVSKDLLAESLSFTDSGQTTVVKCSPTTQSSKFHHISPTVISANLKSERRPTVKPTASLLSFRGFTSNCESSTVQYCCCCPSYSDDSGKAPAGCSVPADASQFSGVSKEMRTIDGGGLLLHTSSPPRSSLSTLSLKSLPLSPHFVSKPDKNSSTSSNTFFPATRCKNNRCPDASDLATTTTITAATTTINNKTFSNSPALEDKKKCTENISLASSSSPSPLTTTATTFFPGLSSQSSSSSSLSSVLSALCSLLLTKPLLFASLSANLSSSLTTTIASCRQTVAWQPQRLLLLLLGLLTLLSVAAGECKVNMCQKHWPAYHISRNKDSSNTDSHSCISLRTTWHCIHKVTRGCAGSLEYYTEKSRVKSQMELYKCPFEGDIYNTTNAIQRPPAHPPDPECIYNGKGAYKHCGLFGDPHLRTFDHKCQTCKIEGAWPLVNNKHLIVMVTNKRVGLDSSATATSLLTVMIKRNDKCGSTNVITYVTHERSLPNAFDGGATHYGPGKEIELKVLEPSKYVKIHIKYIDTTILVRHIGRYFTFSIRMPEEIVNSSTADEQPELCVDGCPKLQQIDYKKFLARRQEKLREYERENKIDMLRVEAETACRNANVAGFYFDSCVFDLMTTGDNNFTAAAYNAWQDLLKLNPEIAKNGRNRTDLSIYDSRFSGISPLGATTFTNLLVLSCTLLTIWLHCL